MDSSFTDVEKRFVLAEMIKVSHIEIGSLVDFVKSFELQPDWLSMQLPNGRNLNQCMRAAQSMGLMHLQPPIMPAMKRKSPDNLNEPAQKRLAITPVEPQPMNYHHPRIQPRPLQPQNGYQALPPPAASPTVSQTSIGRKRGRPSKADKEAQARANAPGSFAHPTTPVPLAPHPPPPPPPPPPRAAQVAPSDFGANNPNQPPFYHISPGPGDPKPKKKGGRAPSIDTTQPRELPENPLEHVQKTPTLGNLIQAAPIEPPLQRPNLAANELARVSSGTSPQPLAPVVSSAPLEQVRTGSLTPLPPVNTRA